jgi:peptide-methionine (S)-S-oxide reductase
MTSLPMPGAALSTAVFGGGCFWCTEAVFAMLRGVARVTPGYAGGTVPNPTYEQVCAGGTGHAEAVRIEYDPAQVAYEDLLTVFFATHDPTTLNRQGNDVGPQYRSAVFYADEAQKAAAEKYVAELDASAPGGAPIVTEIAPLTAFYEAEDYHKDYYARNKDAGYCQVVIAPKVAKAKERFAALLAENAGGGAA